jgi:hypothetical protein
MAGNIFMLSGKCRPPSLRRNARLSALITALLAALGTSLAGCSSLGFDPAGALPGANSIPGWNPAGKVQTYTRDTLFDYIDGTSEYFFTYSFEAVSVRGYRNAAGAELHVEAWMLAVPQDAYGLFSGREAGEPAAVGSSNAARLESGSRLVFWQNRFYVTVTALESAADDDLRLFAEFISAKLPAGGEPPPLAGRLPPAGLIPDSVKFFHKEMAVQDRLWLGGENLLGLDADTDCVLARYSIGGAERQLLLVQYPDAERADPALQALRNGEVEDVAACDRNGALLGAVFGTGDRAPAEDLLAKALAG